MAGEIFIARQDTLETVKGTVDGIDSGVKQTNNALGNFAGGGTSTVKTELETLKNNMAQLQTKVDQLQTKVDQLLSKGSGELKLKKLISSDNDIPLNKDIKIIVIPAVEANETLGALYAEIKTKGSLKFNNVEIANNGSYTDHALPIGIKFILNISDGGVSAGITNVNTKNVFIFECE